MSHRFSDVAALKDELAGVDYLSDEGIAGVVYLADRLQKPILVEGPAGTGKTQLAKSVSEVTGARLLSTRPPGPGGTDLVAISTVTRARTGRPSAPSVPE